MYMEDASLLDLDGCVVGVDSNGWVHSGAMKCARELALNIPTSRYFDYFMNKVDLLLENGITPTLVFDGAPLPAKFEESIQRDKVRKQYLTLALEHEAAGNMGGAYDAFKKAVKVTPQMVYIIVQELKRRQIDYIIAPYEADAQLAFLCKHNKVEAVISDDSDMIPYGCKRVFFKLDWDGYCTEYKSANLSRFSQLKPRKKKSSSFDLSSFTHEQILNMCAFAGCDYLKQIKGIKIGKAYQLARDFKDYHLAVAAEKGLIDFPDNYCELFHRAIMTYRHQAVYNPDSEEIVHLSECNNTGKENLDYLGQLMTQPLAKRIATGQIDPCTRLSYEVDEWMIFNIQTVASSPNKEIMGLLEAEEELEKLYLKSILLEDTWKLWWDNPCVPSSSTSLPYIHTFCTFGEFIRTYKLLPRPSHLVCGDRLFLFRKEREPDWEDPDCGRWTVALAKSEADKCWLRLLQIILGEELDHASEVYGASVNITTLERVKMAIWTKNAVNRDLQIGIGKYLKKLLDYKNIAGYTFHEDAKKVEKGVKIKYTV